MVKCRNCEFLEIAGSNKGLCRKVHRKIKPKCQTMDMPCNFYRCRFTSVEKVAPC